MKTIKYNNVFFNPNPGPDGNPWWYDTEHIEQGSRRVVQNWVDDDATLVFDGTETWTTNWQRGNPPSFMAQFFYYFVNLPWLTQDDGVVLRDVEMVSIPGSDVEHYAIEMSFSDHPSPVKSGLDTYRLFIHPETWQLAAYEYKVGYASLLDLMQVPDGKLFGPMLRYHDSFVDVDGLLFPARMHTGSADGSQTWGYHLMTDYLLAAPFDSSDFVRPPSAIVDRARRDR